MQPYLGDKCDEWYGWTMETVIDLDSRKRLPLARIVDDDDERFIVEKRSDGTILLIPAVALPKWLAERVADPAWHEDMAAADAEFEAGETYDRAGRKIDPVTMKRV